MHFAVVRCECAECWICLVCSQREGRGREAFRRQLLLGGNLARCLLGWLVEAWGLEQRGGAPSRPVKDKNKQQRLVGTTSRKPGVPPSLYEAWIDPHHFWILPPNTMAQTPGFVSSDWRALGEVRNSFQTLCAGPVPQNRISVYKNVLFTFILNRIMDTNQRVVFMYK